MSLQSPYPYFGGKSKILPEIWKRFGNVDHFVDPFLGSGASILKRPAKHYDPVRGWPLETVNDINGYIANAWRALSSAPDEVARYADWPANQNDLTARHYWLVQRQTKLVRRLEGEPTYFDAQIAGWWLWGMALWIGGGFCSSNGPWTAVGGELVRRGSTGRGIQRQGLHLGSTGQGIQRRSIDALTEYFTALSTRFSRVRVNCTDWTSLVSDAVLFANGRDRCTVGLLLDPPYTHDGRTSGVYNHDDPDIWHAVKQYALQRGTDERVRIAYCAYTSRLDPVDDWLNAGWTPLYWKGVNGYGGPRKNGVNTNRDREVIWFSPACLAVDRHETLPLFAEA